LSAAARSPRRRRADSRLVDRATHTLWTLNHPNLWQVLGGERDWTVDEHEQCCADAACSQLLR